MTATKAIAKHVCVRCGKKQPADKMIYSTHTRSRYCQNMAACDRRAKKAAA